MTLTRQVCILSPELDQARVVGQLLKRVDPGCRLIGMTMPGEGRPFSRHPYDLILPFSENVLSSVQLVPTGSRSTSFLLQRGNINLGSITMTPDVLRFYDKVWSLGVAEQAGVPSPKTWVHSHDIESFPVFYKSGREGGGDRGIAYRSEDLPRLSDGLIFQEYIASAGTYGVSFVAVDGNMRASHIHHEIESYPEVGGSAVVIEEVKNDKLARYAAAILRRSNFSGWGLIEFKYCPTRRDYVFMELNAKLWASCEFTFRNEPTFSRLLFDAEPLGRRCQRMIFMHRAFARGPRFLMTSLCRFFRSSELRFVNGMWQPGLARLIVPRRALALLRRFRAG